MVSLSIVDNNLAVLHFKNSTCANKQCAIQLDIGNGEDDSSHTLKLFTISLDERNKISGMSFDAGLLPAGLLPLSNDEIVVTNRPDALCIMLISQEKYMQTDGPPDLLTVKPRELYIKLIKGKIISVERVHGDDPISF